MDGWHQAFAFNHRERGELERSQLSLGVMRNRLSKTASSMRDALGRIGLLVVVAVASLVMLAPDPSHAADFAPPRLIRPTVQRMGIPAPVSPLKLQCPMPVHRADSASLEAMPNVTSEELPRPAVAIRAARMRAPCENPLDR